MVLESRQLRRALLASAAVIVSATPVLAGGFAIREQSTVFQGTSFAGDAAGGALSSMFWNPAALAQHNKGLTSESAYTVILPQSEIHALPGSTLLAIPGMPADSGNIGKDALVPSSYLAYAISDKLVLGLGINSPFGLATEPENRRWAGQTQARTSEIKTINLNPTIGYQISPQLMVGLGVQIEWINARLKSASGPFATSQNVVIAGEDIGLGFTAGVLWKPAAWTSIGLGFRSSIDHTLEGDMFLAQTPITNAGIKANVKTPEIVTLSLRQGLTSQLTFLGTVEWTNWSRLQKLDINCTAKPVVGTFCAGGVGSTITSLPLGWHDGLFVSGGLEFAATPALMLRTGLAWERSPIQNPEERTPRTPDADRIWASAGLSYAWSKTTTIDLAYSHIWVEEARINRVEPGALPDLVADVKTSIDIVSFGLRMKLGADPEPLK